MSSPHLDPLDTLLVVVAVAVGMVLVLLLAPFELPGRLSRWLRGVKQERVL